jgi:hypothetical protein
VRYGPGRLTAERRLGVMDGFIQAIGNGITGLVVGSFTVIGQTLRGIVDSLSRALPGGWLAAVVFVVLVVAAWQLAKR